MPSNVQNKFDLSKDQESPDLNNEITETPTNETAFTGNYYYCTMLYDYALYGIFLYNITEMESDH